MWQSRRMMRFRRGAAQEPAGLRCLRDFVCSVHTGEPPVKRQESSVGNQLGVEHYDGALARVGRPLESSPWLSVYAHAADLLATRDGPICDIGCGTGRLARLLWLRGERAYVGLDFSSARIDEARRYCPDLDFSVADLYEPEVRQRLADYQRFVALEFLEHVEDDLGVIEAMPRGALVVFSIPTYDSAGHVRWFSSPEEAVDRYGGLLELDAAHAAVLPRAKRPEKKIFVLSGIRC